MDKYQSLIVIIMMFTVVLTSYFAGGEYRRGYRAGKKAGVKQERERIAEQKEAYPEMFESNGDETHESN